MSKEYFALKSRKLEFRGEGGRNRSDFSDFRAFRLLLLVASFFVFDFSAAIVNVTHYTLIRYKQNDCCNFTRYTRRTVKVGALSQSQKPYRWI